MADIEPGAQTVRYLLLVTCRACCGASLTSLCDYAELMIGLYTWIYSRFDFTSVSVVLSLSYADSVASWLALCSLACLGSAASLSLPRSSLTSLSSADSVITHYQPIMSALAAAVP